MEHSAPSIPHANALRTVTITTVVLFAAAFATALFISAKEPRVPGYRPIAIGSLRDDGYLKAVDGQKIWITGGITLSDDELVSSYAGHPMSGPFVTLKPAPGAPIQIPPDRDDFGPFGILHVTNANQDTGRAMMTLDVLGERDWHHVPQWVSAPSVTLTVVASVSLLAAITLCIQRTLLRMRRWHRKPARHRAAGAT